MLMTGAGWYETRHSNPGNCVQVRAKRGPHGTRLLVRNSNYPDGAVLGFGAAEWKTFLEDVKAGKPIAAAVLA